MEENEFKDIAEEVIKDLDFSKLFEQEAEEDDQIGLWIPIDYKARFSQLQKSTKKKFGKLMKKVVMTCIDRAESFKKVG